MTSKGSSSHGRNLFVSVDGPSGAGKTTIVRHLAQILVAQGEHVHVTAEPSSGPIGKLASELTETVTGHSLACLYAADRYHHIETEIIPHLKTGHIVITDRYIASGLVVQRFDGVDPVFLWQLNEDAERPDLVVILEADPDVVADRLRERGRHTRFQFAPDSSHKEVEYYRQATETLDAAGFCVLQVDCSRQPPEQSAAFIRDRLMLLVPNEVVDS
ncbi:dTMP kinase [Actinocrispum wychmicini]|uniref:Thymidylate kinase n=1 Tax=Actinocrispum wychmicini TaxID=1213861 RepID=A0A4R2JU78_9PSEU|nr:dTMP kinase [Actinocrispum wychmicini]TCO60569.1 dTMP kinase [Actinocrispum wychmicini]